MAQSSCPMPTMRGGLATSMKSLQFQVKSELNNIQCGGTSIEKAVIAERRVGQVCALVKEERATRCV